MLPRHVPVLQESFLRSIHWMHYHSIPSMLTERKLNLTQAVTEAEKVVGYPTSFLNLRWLLTDELANVAVHMRRLIATNHPLLETARNMFMGNNNNMPSWGLIVLLVSNTCGVNKSFSDYDRDVGSGVLYSQRVLAEVTEMIRTSNILHKNVESFSKEIDQLDELNFGNKIALLSGDFLLSRSFHQIALLKNSRLNEIMSSSLRDLSEVNFIGDSDQNIPIPCMPVNNQSKMQIADCFGSELYPVKDILGNPIGEWTLRNILGGASLLAKSCQCALILADHSEDMQKLAYIVGKNIALAWQAKIEQDAFTPGQSGPFCLVSAPVMVHLNHFPNLYETIKRCAVNVSKVDYESIRKEIQSGPGIEGSQHLQQNFCNEALNALNELPDSDARKALENIVNTM